MDQHIVGMQIISMEPIQ